jgi:DNA-binding Lrp family transcriptional regulator
VVKLLEAFVLIKVIQIESTPDLDFIMNVEKKIAELKGVKQVKGVFGIFDFVATVEAQTPEELGILVTQTLRNVKGIEQTETLIVGF